MKKKGLFSDKRSALVTIFLEPNNSSSNLASILSISDQAPDWSNRPTATIVDVSSFIRQKIKLNGEFYGIGLREIDEGLGLNFFWKEKQYRKKYDNKMVWDADIIWGKCVRKVVKRYWFNFIGDFQRKGNIKSGNNIYITQMTAEFPALLEFTMNSGINSEDKEGKLIFAK